MKILSFHAGHDSTVCLIDNGKIVANIQEERVNHIKHCVSLPVDGLDLLLKSTCVNLKEIDIVGIPSLVRMPILDLLFGKLQAKTFRTNKGISKTKDIIRENFVRSVINLVSIGIRGKVSFPSYQQTYKLKKNVPIYYVDHHTSHAASAYYTSGFDKCLVITADGQGDYLSTTAYLAENGRLSPLIKISREGSLGFFYGIVTEGLGWQIGEGEGKTMGLAPYGNYDKVKGKLDFITPIYQDGKLIRGRMYGLLQGWETNGVLHIHFPQSSKVKDLIEKYGRENVAAEAQRVLEEQMLSFVVPWIKKTKVTKMAAAGGVFLNVKMNQRIWETGLLKDLYIYPDAGDGGISVGAALYIYNNLFDHSKEKYAPKRINNLYLGPQYSNEYIEKVFKIRNLKYKKLKSEEELVKTCARHLAKNKIVGWFQGKMESGPRALGNRSILMSPTRLENKDIINARVKYRESFRPFCPSMTKDAIDKYLINPTPLPDFMIISFNIYPEKIKDIPAVVHVDKTARPQLVTKKSNPLYHKLIKEFGKLKGVEVLLNTSFNIKGQPIVCSPEDAIKCFYDTGIDYLFIGNFMLQK